ncbi:hypothetical protein CYMTET_4303 [Cymbomonas tetramitiformis]|uniref:BED-type domain-containing protein n=1 Tax=Cymbomonas tetramitiformis TaxID=36881 RepID=A0AAE0H1U7_9CHLO|nr:hypothetical protein CYMTET_4303 [Cymbomonas tetramitiformis]
MTPNTPSTRSKLVDDGKAQWLIGWENFPDPKHDTWEPIEHLAGHEGEISGFRKRTSEKQAQLEIADAERRRESARTREDSLPDDGFVEAAGGKRRSPVWEHYKVTIDDESGNILYTKCKLCTDVVLVKYPGNTTNLRGHISGCHKDVYCKMVSTLLHNNSIDQ